MSFHDDCAFDDLLARIGAELERTNDERATDSEAQLQWLAKELRNRQRADERAADAVAATAFAKRVSAKLAARRTMATLPAHDLRVRPAECTATALQSMAQAAAVHCVPLLELAAAAGVGRELWDEPCDTWLELPEELGPGRFAALRVAGDSMTPVLETEDVVLVDLDAEPRVDDLVVARVGDDGCVVKRLSLLTAARIDLSSFNQDYPTMALRQGAVHVLGVVVARFTKKRDRLP